MTRTGLGPAYGFSAVIAGLAATAAAVGLFVDGLYRDNDFVTATWRGADLVTLVVAVPVLVASLVLAQRGSRRARLVWLGMLDYTLYTYAFYLFGAAFNKLFLIYAALVALSILALVFALPGLEVEGMGRDLGAGRPVGWVSGWMVVLALGLGGLWIAQSLAFVATGTLPGIVDKTGHPTNVVFALDLTLLVPFLVLAVVWLRQRQPWGYALAAIVNVKGAVYPLTLASGTVFAHRADEAGLAELPLWILLAVGCLVAAGALLRDLRPVGGAARELGSGPVPPKHPVAAHQPSGSQPAVKARRSAVNGGAG